MRRKLLAHRLDALCAEGLTNALTSDQNTDCLQIRVEFTIGRVKGMAARFAEHGFLTALFTLRHDDILIQKLRTQSVMLPQAGMSGKMESQRLRCRVALIPLFESNPLTTSGLRYDLRRRVESYSHPAPADYTYS